MKITVFTSSYNYSKFLRQSIESVLNQTYTDFEYHLIDYGSTDDTWKIMNEYKDDRIIARQIGFYPVNAYAVNYSASIATGQYWSWCLADDMWVSTLLERKVEYAHRHPKSVLYDDFYIINEMGIKITETELSGLTPDIIKRQVWEKSPIAFTGIFIPTYVFQDLGLLFPTHYINDDFYWMIKATIFDIPFEHVPEKLHYKRTYDHSMCNKNYKEVISNMQKIWDELKPLRGEKDFS